MVNLDTRNVQSGWVEFGFGGEAFEVQDLLGSGRYTWHGGKNYINSTRTRYPRTSSLYTGEPIPEEDQQEEAQQPQPEQQTVDPLWYKDAVIYQLHVKAFFDSNNDGIGDFRGLTSKLDYIQELGVNAVWLLPFYPVAAEGRRLRRRRLPQRPPAIRHPLATSATSCARRSAAG